MRRKLAAGNWKMNGSRAALEEIKKLAQKPAQSEVLICPPATLIAPACEAASGSEIMIGAQDCHSEDAGAHTGDLSAQMVSEAGASHVILGHSERRADHGETSEMVRAKVEAACNADLIPIVCVGESAEQRASGEAEAVVTAQAIASLPEDCDARVVLAYEPIWAIGTGETATTEDIAAMHSALRAAVSDAHGFAHGQKVRILYGGSVKPANAAEIFAVEDVDGALVGGASLKASDFGAIISALDNA